MSRRITLRFIDGDTVYALTTVRRHRRCDHCEGKGRLRTLGKEPHDVVCLECHNTKRADYDVPIVQRAVVVSVSAGLSFLGEVELHYKLHAVKPARAGDLVRRLRYKGLGQHDVFKTDAEAMKELKGRDEPVVPSRERYTELARRREQWLMDW